MKRVLVASDLSARSDWAVARAAMLAKLHDCRLTILHVVDEELPAAIADRQSVEAQGNLRQFVASLSDAGPTNVDIEVKIGAGHEAVIEQAEHSDADLVVIGKHRRDILLDLFRGSTGERVIRLGTRPVLVVKQRPQHDYVKVLIAVDFSATCRKALELSLRFLPHADYDLVHAFDIPFRGLLFGAKSMDEVAKKHQRQFHDLVAQQTAEFVGTLSRPVDRRRMVAREGRPEEVIAAVIDELVPQLVVVGTHGRSGLAKALLGSTAEAVLASAPCDVLAVRGW